MSKSHAVIYIPGLGDHRIRGQLTALRLWKLQGIETHLVQMNWADAEAFAPKLERIVAKIDELHASGKKVSLAAASAGASAAMNAYAMRTGSIHGLVSICGKLSPEGVSSVDAAIYGRNRAFQESMTRLAASGQAIGPELRSRILSLHPLADESVPVRETKLPGCVQRTMPVAGHFLGIAYGITLGSFGAIRFLRRLN